MLTNMRIQSDLLTFLRDRWHGEPPIDAETDLFDSGVLDSLLLLDLILHILQVHGIALLAPDVTRTNFCTVARLASLVASRTGIPSHKAA